MNDVENNLISVVIPFYSNEKGILIRSVSSALSQQSVDLEVIVVDDASPVPAADELASINDQKLRIIRHQKNSNGGIARNTGIENSKGKYVAFLDFDDVWYERKLIKQLEYYKDLLSINTKPVVYSQSNIIDGSRKYVRPTRAIRENERVGDYLFCGMNIIQTSGIFLAKRDAEEAMFANLKRHQDYQFCLELEHHKSKFYLLEEPTYDFIQTPKKHDLCISLEWLSVYSKYLTKNAIKGFKCNIILRLTIHNIGFWAAIKYAIHNSLYLCFFNHYIRFMLKKTMKYYHDRA